ncbi:glycosyltransferase family 4 protein [Pseudomonas sp. GL-RE-19]|uniref:glycosyltransferase family 4 protein n=1 Tax=Pseudomonas sp. GL-RE-19 TaxID=2832389 RepID=UPI001CBF5693|nr:glycosyltransferase family 1 protein [Pseudomonas sp. GL-RE-19]
MKILIDGYYIDKPRGLGRYVQELIHAIGNGGPSNLKFTVIVPSDVPEEDLIQFPNISYVRSKRLPFPVWEQFFFPLFLLFNKYDVVHFPYNTKPVFINYMRINHVVTLHDLTFMQYGGYGYYQRLGAFYRRTLLKFLKSSFCKIVTVSYQSKVEIKNLVGVDSFVVYTSVARFMSQPIRKATSGLFDLKEYFVHIGGIAEHKNSRLTIDAFIAAGIPNVKLVVLGVGSSSDLALHYRDNPSVFFPGWVSDNDVKNIVSDAMALIFPSLKEGYGLPIVEAFGLGCPVITSNIPPMSEVGGDAVYKVNPSDFNSLKSAFENIYVDDSLRARLIVSGTARYKLFTVESMSNQMLEIYNS